MSQDLQTPDNSSKRKSHKHKDPERSSKKASSRKRAREADGSEELASPTKKAKTRPEREHTDDRNVAKKSKKHRKASKSPFVTLSTALYLPLSPIAQSSPLHGLCAEHLSPLLLTYVPTFEGIVVSYSNPQLSSHPPAEDVPVYAQSINEYAVSYAWLTADFLVLRPDKGVEMEGYVNVQNETRLGVLCWNLFNASIERKRLPKDWSWDGPTSRKRRKRVDVDDEDAVEAANREDEAQRKEEEAAEGTFMDEDGESVRDRLVKFRLVDWDVDQSSRPPAEGTTGGAGLVSFEGTMLSVEEEDRLEREVMKKEAERREAKRKALKRKQKPLQAGRDAVVESEEI